MKKLIGFLSLLLLSLSVRANEIITGVRVIYDMKQVSGPNNQPWAWADAKLDGHQMWVMGFTIFGMVLVAFFIRLANLRMANRWSIFGIFAVFMVAHSYLVVEYIHAVHIRATRPEPFMCGYVFRSTMNPNEFYTLAFEQPYSCLQAGQKVMIVAAGDRYAVLPTSDIEPYKLK